MSDRLLSRQELFDLVWSKPMVQLAKDFGLSDVGLAKACKRYKIPRPDRGYWAKLAVGKAPKRPTLPPAVAGDEDVRFSMPTPVAERVLSPEVATWIEREQDPANRVDVPATVHKYHPLVKRTKDELEAHGENHRGLRWARDAGLRLNVGSPSIARACRLLHALFGAIEERGWRIERANLDYHTATVHVLGETIDLTFEERSTRKEHELTPDEERRSRRGETIYPVKWDNVPSGVFRLTMSHFGAKRTFADRKNDPIEAHLNEIIVAMVRIAIEDARPWRLEREEEERRRAKAEEERRVFENRRDRFEAAFHAWKEHRERTTFVELLEASLAAQEPPSDAGREFVAWTRRYVDASEPLARFFDALAKNEQAKYRQFTTESPRRFW